MQNKKTYIAKGDGYTVELSPDFTIDDIHKIREARYNYAKTLTQDERIKYYNSLGKDIEAEIARRRAEWLKSQEAVKD